MPSVSQCLVTSLCTKLEQWVRKTASENRRRWCGRDVARQVVLGVDSGDRKSSVANSRQSCTAERQWCGQRRVFTIRNMSQTAVFYSTQSNGNDGTTIVGLLHTKTVVAFIPLHAAITVLVDSQQVSHCLYVSDCLLCFIIGPSRACTARRSPCCSVTFLVGHIQLHCYTRGY